MTDIDEFHQDVIQRLTRVETLLENHLKSKSKLEWVLSSAIALMAVAFFFNVVS